MAARIFFFIGIAACLTPWTPPWSALILGIAMALLLGNPFPRESKQYSKALLQICVVMLGFSMDLNTVVKAGSEGILFALASISAVFLLGFLLQKALGLKPGAGILVSTGTAICGGSAIAAMSSVLDSDQEDISVAVGTVFLLNAVALLVFPPLGHAFKLTEHQFGTWAGIAIHDVASVVGAGRQYGPIALEVGTAVKLSRVLYLIPITLIATWWQRRSNPTRAGQSAAASFPIFILGFVLASIVRTSLPQMATYTDPIKMMAGIGLGLALYLIGSGITRATLAKVGFRPLILGLALWLFISVAAFVVVRSFA